MLSAPRAQRERALLDLAALDKSDFESVLQRILQTTAETMHTERVSFWSLGTDPTFAIRCEGMYVRSRCAFERGSELLVRQYPRYFQALIADPVVCAHDAHRDPRTREFAESYLEPLGITSMLDVPIWTHGALAGVLCHEHVGALRHWTVDERRFALSVSHVLALSLERREQVRAETALRKSEDCRRMLIEGMTDYAIFMLEPDGRIASWNAGARGIFGFSAKEVVGKPFSFIYPPERVDRGAPARDLERAARKATVEDEGWRMRRDGSRFWASYVTSALRDVRGQQRGFAQVTRDATERKRGNLAAEASTALFSSLDRRTTLDGVARVVVPFLADWCVIDMAEDDGTTRSVAALHDDERKQALLQAFLAERGVTPKAMEIGLRALTTGGAVLFADASADGLAATCSDPAERRILSELGAGTAMAVPFTAHGRPIGAISMFSTMPGRRYEARDLALALDLADRTGLALGNVQRFQRSQEMVHERDEFISIAAHELRTPLTPLLLSLQSLRKMNDTGRLGPEAAQRTDVALRGVARLIRLVDSLLDVARMTAGDLRLEREVLDCGEVVRDVVYQMRDEARGHGSELELDLRARAVGNWDRSRLQQVVVNLLSNAVKYGAGKPIQITVDTFSGMAHLAVRDQGIGIAPQNLDRIFGRFERAGSVRSYGGLGLGLYITRRIVEAHGGTVACASELGKGTTFTVEIPMGCPTERHEDCGRPIKN